MTSSWDEWRREWRKFEEQPNVRRLIAMRMSVLAIPAGGGIADGVRVLLSSENLAKHTKEATAWAAEAIATVRRAAAPNPWAGSSDEEIAAELVRGATGRRP